ncbi:MAG TPA: carboxymuconolactone decarboxylase, partial [Alphaproteobacteria bacterium]
MSTLVSRIQEIPEDKLTAEQAQVFKDLVAGRGRLLTPYKIWIHSPKLAAAMERIGTFLNKASSLTEREVELVICLIAHHWKGDYVFAAHEKRCLELGYPKAAIDAIRAD